METGQKPVGLMSEAKDKAQAVIEIAARVADKFGCDKRVATIALYRKVELVTKTKVYSIENLLAAEKEMSKRNINAAENAWAEYQLMHMLGYR